MTEKDVKKPKSEINLRKLMQKLGMGTNAFSEACGVSSQSMSQFLRAGKSLTTNTIYRIAVALDIDPRDMFFPTEEEENEYVNTNMETEKAEQPLAEKEDTKKPSTLQTTTFCPHCGTKVKIGVVMIEA